RPRGARVESHEADSARHQIESGQPTLFVDEKTKARAFAPVMKTRIAIVVAEFNKEITGNLLACALGELSEHGVKLNQIKTVWVPGAYELPYAALQLAKTKKFDAVLCLGCVIKGDTSHDFHVASWAAIGIGQASLATSVPVLFGVLTP